ncbi:MAG: transglutaminase-like domain-containing protein [Caulobacteraceae bacterium]
MDRRQFLGSSTAGVLCGIIGAPAFASAAEQSVIPRQAEITTTLDVSEHKGAVQAWSPIFENVHPYQRVSAPKITCSGKAEVVHDDHYGAKMVRATWGDGEPKTLTVVQTVETRNRSLIKTSLSEAERRFWLAPTASIPTDGIVKERAVAIVGARTDPKQKARAIYDWIVDNTFRDPQTRGCGLGDIKSLLASQRFGGKCADLNSLMTGLCRASGVPARDVYGIRFAPSNFQKSLGASSPDISHAQHCRSEVWLEGEGWFPVDPADVRKVVLEAKLAVDSPELRVERERLFGNWEMNWVAYNSATDLALPGAPRPMEANFLMYPYGMTPKIDLDWLEPGSFSYKITSQVSA